MKIEYEVTFPDINKNEIRARLKKAGAKMIYPEFLMKRHVWLLPEGHEIEGSWARVRQEADKVTMSVKIVADNKKIEDQKEICITVDSFDTACDILNTLGCQEKAYQESKRELWILDGAEVTIDEWPWLETFVEVEAKTEHRVKQVCKKLDFDYSEALFGSVDFQYADKYNIDLEKINERTPNITFDMPNPWK